ncbi:methyl-accepting chemotaxis protein [Nitrincola alkalisediminis]|uniref:methyl-accepting chemotaxis protein n=1 Tax=Nitrincola alkalisediminis TaxID=1366656 RepID=UPI001874CE95|nr:methyl-accepting chemotaxis protein [Nitrincola alkalisediminis]
MIRGILTPAVVLMNQLNYKNKFWLMSVLFLLPLSITTYVWIESDIAEIQQARHQRQGVNDLIILNEILQAAMLHRDIKSVTYFRDDASLLAFSNQEEAKLRHLIQLYQAHLEPNSDTIWQYFSNEVSHQGAIEAQFAAHQNLVNELFRAQRNIVQRSGLNKEHDENIAHVLELLMRDLPTLLNLLGQVRSFGMYALQGDFLESSLSDRLNLIYDDLSEAQNNFERSARLINLPDVALSSELKSASLTAREHMDEHIISAMSLSMNWQEYFNLISKEINALASSYNVLLPQVDRILEQRSKSLTSQLRTVLFSLSLLLLLILYLYAGFYRSVKESIRHIWQATHRMAEGDMTTRICSQTRDEMSEITNEFNRMIDHVHQLIQAVQKTADEVDHQASKVAEISIDSHVAMQEQQKQTELVAVAMNEMAHSVEEVSTYGQKALASTLEADTHTQQGYQQVTQVLNEVKTLAHEIEVSVQVINQFAADSYKITQVLEVIKSVAEQTNLLALNAAIEAARAGDHGRGFAVVADEVRTLAHRTHQSVEDIELMVSSLMSSVDQSVKAMIKSQELARNTVQESSQVGGALQNIANSVHTIVEMNEQISSAATEQAKVASTIDQNLVFINQFGDSTSKSANQVVAASQQMTELSSHLRQLMARFRV